MDMLEESVDISQQRLLDRNNYIITMATAWITVIPYCNNLRLGREVTVANLFSSGQNFSREMKLDW